MLHVGPLRSRATAASDHDRRGQLALLALVQSARGKDAEAAAALESLRPLLAKVSAGAPEWQRWPELIALSAIHDRPKGGPASSLLDTLANVELKPETPTPRWLRHARHIRSVSTLASPGESGAVAGWSPVARIRAESHGSGDPVAVWSYRGGEWTSTPNDGSQSLELSLPLRAPFEIEAELASSADFLTQIAYGGFRLGVDAAGTHLRVSNAGGPARELALPPAGSAAGPWHRVRLVVRDATLTAFVDDREALEQPIPAGAPPWLAIQSAPGTAAKARGLKVSGSPDIPRTIALSASTSLAGWSADEYGESTSGLNPAWLMRGETIAGNQLKTQPLTSIARSSVGGMSSGPAPSELYATPGSQCESVLRYSRPLPEKGEVAYEFFHEPGKAMTHPVVGRLAFLLEPAGVVVHRLTDAQYERSGLAADNRTIERGNQRGPNPIPLRPREWNRLTVSVAVDQLTLRLNDVVVYECTLEPGSSRLFGLFHLADETEALVRKVEMRGEWAKSLGEVNQASGTQP